METTVYVQNDEKMVYEVELKRQFGDFYFHLNLELVCGWDYVNPDENDIQGYVGKDNFVDDVQFESFTFYPLEENIIERLEGEGFKRIDIKSLAIEHLLSAL